MRNTLKMTGYVLLGALLLTLIPLGLLSASSASAAVQAENVITETSASECVAVQLNLQASNTMPIPDFCIGGLCKLILYQNAAMGAFGEGYAMEAYYYQWGTSSPSWIGGPNLELGGFKFSDGEGNHGNGIAEGILMGATTSDGGYVRIMDDGAEENDNAHWTIEASASESLTRASLHVCAMPDCSWHSYNPDSDDFILDMPDACKDGLCMILRMTYEPVGIFGPGITLPVFYEQDSATNAWFGGPVFNLGGTSFSGAYGVNGNGIGSFIFEGGTTAGGAYARLYDDGVDELSADKWQVDFFDNNNELDRVSFAVCPMPCQKKTISGGGYSHLLSPVDVPGYCVDSLCTIVRWTDGSMGAYGPGHHWPVSYKQNSIGSTWRGGPALCLGGQCFSDGSGLNGDDVEEAVFDSATTDDGGFIRLLDDSQYYVNDPSYWIVDFKTDYNGAPQNQLTEAVYYLCSNTCQETELLIFKQYLPLVNK